MPSGLGYSALVLEDDPSVQLLLKKLLEAAGFTVAVVSDGLEGLVQIEQIKPSIILCDMMMPNLDGVSFTKAIKGHQETKEIPVIFLTAKTDARSFADGMAAGAKFYLGKPFKQEELMAKVYRALGQVVSR
jgi:CheY-like chemotaxis protein